MHGIGEGADYQKREVMAASTFSKAAATAGVERIVYLGGVAPTGTGSEHLRSRLDVGEALRSGPVKTIELRASMIVGYGSLSWLIVRDLAARLPVMVLPRWLKSRTQPVAIDDVVIALVQALDLPLEASAWFDVPGPITLSGKEILEETARVMGLKHPRMFEVPFLSPRLSSLWVRFVTRAKWSVAREVVVGLTEDLLAQDDRFWELVGHPHRLAFAEAARLALAAERCQGPVPGIWGAIERARGLAGEFGMNGDGSESATAPTSTMSLAFACIVVWVIAAASTGTLGIWLAIGGAAAALGVAILLLDSSVSRRILQPSPRLVLLGAAVGGLMAATTYLLYPVLARIAPFIATDTALLYSEFRAPPLVIASVALAPVILGEELVWRNVVQACVRAAPRALGRRHVGGGRVCARARASRLTRPRGGGAPVRDRLGHAARRSASLVPALVAHLVWDVLVLLWLPLDSR